MKRLKIDVIDYEKSDFRLMDKKLILILIEKY